MTGPVRHEWISATEPVIGQVSVILASYWSNLNIEKQLLLLSQRWWRIFLNYIFSSKLQKSKWAFIRLINYFSFDSNLEQIEMFFFNSTLIFGIPPLLIFQLEVNYKVDRLLTGLTAWQKGTTAWWYPNKTFLFFFLANNFISLLF